MSALANHAFAKMNGIGNEIVVVDLRDSRSAVTPEDARAVATSPHDFSLAMAATVGAGSAADA